MLENDNACFAIFHLEHVLDLGTSMAATQLHEFQELAHRVDTLTGHSADVPFDAEPQHLQGFGLSAINCGPLPQ